MEPVRFAAAKLLRELIGERFGMQFDDNNMDIMIDKLSPLLIERGIDSLIDYYYVLKYDNPSNEWDSVIDALTVRETFFWREFDQVRALVDVVMPKLAASGRPVRIWSAACATGEEPLTIAMALEQGGWFDRIPIDIVASDASPAALAAARAGFYRERSFRALSPETRDRFFQSADGRWRVRPHIHERIQWRRVNLTVPSEIQTLATAPVIFCRNVFIYFSEAIIRQIAKVFADRMPRPGYLFLGAAESLLKFTTDFELEEISGAFVYVKEARER
jgi:chemotaxis protein methyltransferase CheR